MAEVGIDEVFLDISDINQPTLEIIREIKKKIGEETGLTCSIGIGPNKLLAKIASDMEKPDGYTFGELAALEFDTLVNAFGKAYGCFLYEASRGIDEEPLVTFWEPRSMSRETTFQQDVGHWQTMAKTLADLTKEVISGLREEVFRAKTITVKIRFSDFKP